MIYQGNETAGGVDVPGLADFKDKHRGGTIVVCGCGESLRDLPHPERFIAIGVNDGRARSLCPAHPEAVNHAAAIGG